MQAAAAPPSPQPVPSTSELLRTRLLAKMGGGEGGGSKKGLVIALVVLVVVAGVAAAWFFYFREKCTAAARFAKGEGKLTALSEEGEMQTQRLDAHNVTCDPNAIQRFRLVRDGAGKFQYSFGCTAGVDLGTATPTSTSFNDNGQGLNIFLDRHDVKCKEGSVLTRFKLSQNPAADSNQYRYDYTCRAVDKELVCRDVASRPCEGWCEGVDGEGQLVYLDRHDVKCDADEAMSQFKLIRPTPDTIGYTYRCCKIK